MNLHIVLSAGGSVEISNVIEVTYFSGNGLKTVKINDFSSIDIHPSITYHFIADKHQLAINGSEIRFVEIYS